MNHEERRALAVEIGEIIKETDKRVHAQIKQIIRICGEDFARDIQRQTLEVEASGGMMTLDGKRRRTIGGVFFRLAKEQMTEEQQRKVFPTRQERKERRKQAEEKRRKWEERQAAKQQASTAPTPEQKLSPEVKAKLKQLHDAADTFRAKIAALEAKPENQRGGLGMTRKLLVNTEQQIAVLMERQ